MPDDQSPPTVASQEGEDPIFDATFDRMLEQTNSAKVKPFSIQRRRISDRVFFSIDETRKAVTKLSEAGEYSWLKGDIPVPINVAEDRGSQHVDVPYISALCLGVASNMALHWQSMDEDAERLMLDRTLQTFVRQIGPGKSGEEVIANEPHWGPIFDALATDVESGAVNATLLKVGPIPVPDADFLVKAKVDPLEQTYEIAAGIFRRIDKVCSSEHGEILRAMSGWGRWEDDVQQGTIEQKSMFNDIYMAVRIKPQLLRKAASGSGPVKERAIGLIELEGGFLHAPDNAAFEAMIKEGVTVFIPDVAYYSVITDYKSIKQLLTDYCGFDPNKEYATIDDLPQVSGKQLSLGWVNKRYALAMFQDPDAVAFSVEVAVKKTTPEHGSGHSRRDAGIASALKYAAYSAVPQPLILTRHFEILEVNDISLPSAVNYGSAYFIQALGGKHIGATEETFIVNPGESDPVKVKVLWHFCLAERATSLMRLEERRYP
ncbi:hypothetical protein HZA45_00295 [Candidatus Peregrinibacteria bacterium]|nr:hypothetical protein [Candidatus Peregrinibacteria bacterium]